MSKGQTLRVLVNERLSAAAEEIFALFERTIAEYELELCRSNEENQRKQRLLDCALNPRVRLHKVGAAGSEIPSQGPALIQNIPETPQIIKEEPEEESFTRGETEQPVPRMLFCVKTEPSVGQQNELREKTEGEDINPALHPLFDTEGQTQDSSDTDNSENWEAPCSYSSAQTEANGDDHNQAYIRDATQSSGLSPNYKSAQGTNATGDMSGTGEGAGRTFQDPERPFQCSVCQKRFWSKAELQRHDRVHTGEKPFSCTVCKKTFGQKSHLDVHKRRHTGERPYSCPVCKQTFTQKSHLDVHERRHTGEKPYSCPVCNKAFINRGALTVHQKSHTGEKPFSCLICEKHFVSKCYLKTHMRLHTGERPYSCAVCKKTFYHNSGYNLHMRRHTGAVPHSCAVCKKAFNCSTGLKVHMKKHTGERPYACSICNKKLTQKSSLAVHMKRKHSGGHLPAVQ